MTNTRRVLIVLVFSVFSAFTYGQRIRSSPKTSPLTSHYTDIVAVVSIAEDSESVSFTRTYAAYLERELSAVGFDVLPPSEASGTTESEIETARSLSEIHSARWVALVRCSSVQSRLLWICSVYDMSDEALIASDAQGAYGGLSALSFMEKSSREVSEQAASLRGRKVPGMHIEYRLRFLSRDEGAQVFFGYGRGSREAGIITNGMLLAPFVAFRAGDPVVVTVVKDGYWPKTHTYYLGDESEEIRLPPLMKQTHESFSLGLATSRLFGATAEYRRFLSSDALYVKAADSLWLQYYFTPGSIPVVHDEVRIGFGIYLFRPRDARFRVAVGTGASGIATLILGGHLQDRFYFDATADPIGLSWEWHLPQWAIVLDQRLSYSLGLDCGLLERGWVSMNDFPMILTLSVVKKW